jgi:hypothetical protein
VTDQDGHYVAKVIDDAKNGATIGKNQVRFSAHSPPTDPDAPGPRPKPSVKIPARYWYESEIELDVPAGGTKTADFELKSP